MKKLAIVLALCMASSIVVGGVVFAGKPAGSGAGKASLYDSEGYTCLGGASETTGPTYGFVILNTNASGDLIVQVALKGATANATYDIWVNQDPGACPLDFPTAPGALTTNDDGNGNAHVKIARYVDATNFATNFWVSAVGGGQVLRSTAVVLD